ncbi:hypothetical protein V8F06_011222 [Rhypophila decipiens]
MSFATRRTSALLRFVVPAFLIILVLYYWTSPSPAIYSVSSPNVDKARPEPPQTHDTSGVYPTHENTENTNEGNSQGQTAPQAPSSPKKEDIPPAPPVAPPAPSAIPPVAPATHATSAAGTHPIDIRIRAAEEEFEEKLSRESKSLEEAAAAYRKRRGRHPPPGFKEWYDFATENKAVMVEDFWDQIYHDLEPFWAKEPSRTRKDAWEFEMRINIRDHNATTTSGWFWTKIWISLIKEIEHLLPDMDIPLNAMDEPRVIVPWEDMDGFMTKAHKTRAMKEPADVVSTWSKLLPADQDPEESVAKSTRTWDRNRHFWEIVRRGCAPDSPARQAEIMTDFTKTPMIQNSLAAPHMENGYVKNYTLSTEFCHQPDLQALNGIFVEPITVAATDDLFPLFGGSKLAVNNEILLPAPMYWNEEERFVGKQTDQPSWSEKNDGAVWRGVATGGKNRENNWKAFQRHRFVAMNNGTKLTRAEEWSELPNNFALPPSNYHLGAQEEGKLGEWVGSWADVAFVDLMCETKQTPAILCNYTNPYYSVKDGMKLDKQFHWKYMPDIDGNSFSGRYLGFLRSTSLPIKATLWREWHDSRLVAWKHFVPMDNRFTEWYGIMEYFLGYKGRKGHDEEAENIALTGRDWAQRVLRKEDMKIYVLRLLLEYARVSDDRRERMGWVEDLVGAAVEDPDA